MSSRIARNRKGNVAVKMVGDHVNDSVIRIVVGAHRDAGKVVGAGLHEDRVAAHELREGVVICWRPVMPSVTSG